MKKVVGFIPEKKPREGKKQEKKTLEKAADTAPEKEAEKGEKSS